MDQHGVSAGAQDGKGTCTCSLIPSREFRDFVQLTLVLAPAHPLSPVQMRVIMTPTVTMLAAHQVATDTLCLSILTSALVQDFARAAWLIALLAGQASEPLGLSALQPDVPLPQSVEAGLVLGLVQETSWAPVNSSAPLHLEPLLLPGWLSPPSILAPSASSVLPLTSGSTPLPAPVYSVPAYHSIIGARLCLILGDGWLRQVTDSHRTGSTFIPCTPKQLSVKVKIFLLPLSIA